MSIDQRRREPADMLARWLLDGPAQVGAGPHLGAVAGSIDRHGRARYAYPEITGYFLQWLAWRMACGGDRAGLAVRAASAQHWLCRWCGTEAPPTRVYLDAPEADWRNAALFCFDLAMVLRGIAAAARARLLDPDPALVATLGRLLASLIEADGAFAACVPLRSGPDLPQRWSTCRGGFLAKAAAGILAAGNDLAGLPTAVIAAAQASFGSSLQALASEPHADVHPLLYGFEGALSRPDDPRVVAALPALAARFDALLAVADTLGGVPETLGGEAANANLARCDVLAQTLRVGALLAWLRPQDPPDQRALARLRGGLLARIKPNGALPFGAGAGHAVDNVWATMFAEQALVLTATQAASPLAQRAGPLLV